MSFYCAVDGCDGVTKVMQTSGMYRRRKCFLCDALFLTEEIEYIVPRDQLNPFSGNNVKAQERQRAAIGETSQGTSRIPQTPET